MKYIFLILLLFTLYICKKNDLALGPTSYKVEVKNDSIVGKYFVEYFRPGSDFIMLKTNPAKHSISIVFELDFLHSGNINTTDLTKTHMCGNGVLSVSEAKWKSLGNNLYQLHFIGEYAYELKFDFIGNYKLTNVGRNKQMTLLNTITLEEKRLY